MEAFCLDLEVVVHNFKPASSAGPTECHGFSTEHRPSIQGAWSCTNREREGEGERENKHGLKKDALHEFPKNLKGKYCNLAGDPEEACGQ